jgi:hypothetical protein
MSTATPPKPSGTPNTATTIPIKLCSGNLPFTPECTRVRSDNGDKVFEIDLGTSQMGPPISFTIDGKQYVAVTAGPSLAIGAGGGAPAGGSAPARPAHLFVLGLDGKAALPN